MLGVVGVVGGGMWVVAGGLWWLGGLRSGFIAWIPLIYIYSSGICGQLTFKHDYCDCLLRRVGGTMPCAML